eukprot:TRINITY_DN29513_c0_g1_i1.p1 TRINITY_DN29513_c0_g1~~TRINITY_DN29513_c0_g1_i1.p1  ORF type:complete len:481 (-),score=55.79 TRINITY_DN29513_c0_g1_i1:82-1341(-)
MVENAVTSGCASVVLRRGKVIHCGAWGHADIEAGTNFTIDTICRMVCGTKSFLTVAFMTLVEEGRASPDDRLDKYLPQFANVLVRVGETEKLVPQKRPILMKHLMVHTSGIGYSGEVGDKLEDLDADTARFEQIQRDIIKGSIVSLEEFVDAIAEVPLSFQPGYKYQYGFSFDVLGRVIEVIMGKKLDKCLQERVFGPLGMKDTKWAVSDADIGRLSAYYASATTCQALYGSLKGRKSRGSLYRIDGHSAKDSNWCEGKQAKVVAGGGFLGYLSGGVLSTVRDNLRFVQMLFHYGKMENGKRLLKKSTVAAMEKNRLNERTSGTDKVCYLGNIGCYRDGVLTEYGMGGASATYWNIDRGDETSTVWFSQNRDIPEYSLMKGVNAKKADLWGTLHEAVVRAAKRAQTEDSTSKAKRARTS